MTTHLSARSGTATDLATPDLFALDLAAVNLPSAPLRARPPAALLTTHEHIGFELGWDHAHHGVTPPAPHAQDPSPLRHGWMAGVAAFDARTLAPTPAVRQWLQLRLHAWLHGRNVELFQVTPRQLQRLAVSHCPITRLALDHPGDAGQRASIDRVRNDAGYAAGNLVVLSAQAQLAKAAHGFESALGMARRLEASGEHRNSGPQTHDGLGAQPWGRLAVLCSFVEPLPHARAASLPLLVLPPNRLRLFNPVQALQAFISRQLLNAGWSQRINAFEALLPSAPVRRAFRGFFQAWLPRVLEAGRSVDPQQARWAIEDAWRHAPVMQRWVRFATLLDAPQCEALLSRAVAHGLLPGGLRVEVVADDLATEGWCLNTKGCVPHGRVMRPSRRRASPDDAPVAQTVH